MLADAVGNMQPVTCGDEAHSYRLSATCAMAEPSARVSLFLPSPMESGQNRKQKAQDSMSLGDAPAKKRTPASRQCFATPFPPSFYDNLSDLPLTFNVLRELNRRNKARDKAAKPSKTLALPTEDLSQFARRGGPDLQHLRQV